MAFKVNHDRNHSKNSSMRKILSYLILAFTAFFGFLSGLFMFISACANKVPWEGAFQNIMIVFGFTVTMFFGYLYLLGAPKSK